MAMLNGLFTKTDIRVFWLIFAISHFVNLPALAAADYPSATWVPTYTSNCGDSSRGGSNNYPNNCTGGSYAAQNIQYIVIHAFGGGTYANVINWFQTSGAGTSAHYLISRTGQVTQMVRDEDVAFQAGNLNFNKISIGIEHEDSGASGTGNYNSPGWVTESMYQASADLVKFLANRYGIPIDRNHIIGHHQVPHPNNPASCPFIGPDIIGSVSGCQYGGINGKIDPYIYWDWSHYMSLFNQDKTIPIVTSFTASTTSITLGGTITFNYSVTDSGGSNLNRVELWRSTDGINWPEPPNPLKVNSAAGAAASGTFTDTPTSIGTYYYGIHALDNANNQGLEPQKRQVSVVLPTYALTVAKSGTGSGTVTSSPAGISCGSDCSENYTSGTTVTLTAAAASGSSFTGWSGSCSGTGTCTVTMSAARNVTATFTANTTTYTVTASAGVGGSASCSPSLVASGGSSTCTAMANSGYTFSNWSGSCAGQGATCTLPNITANKSSTANFTQNTYALTVAKSGTGSGTVTSSPAGISCGSDCSENYTSGTTVTLTAAAASGSSFTGWSGSCSGTGTCTVTMSAARNVTATFTANTTTYTVTASAGVGGSASCSPSLVASGGSSTCTAMANSGYTFSNWSGSCAGQGATCTLPNITANKSSTANFTQNTYALTVAKSGTGSGTVTSSPAGISCGSDCSENYTSGTTVTLTAAAASGSSFTGWSGSCSGTGTCTVTMSAARNVTATFTANTTTYTVTASAGVGGSASCSPSLVASGGSSTCTAMANSGYTFSNWSGSCAGQGATCTLPNITANKSSTANFTQNTYALTVAKSGTGSGTVTSSPAGISCGSDCSENYTSGTTVTLTAAAASGSSFTGWSGSCSGTGTCTVTMSAARNVTATFTANTTTYTVTASAGAGGSISPTSQSVQQNSTATFTVTPSSGYAILSVVSSCGGSLSGNTYTTAPITAACTVTASFQPTYTVTATAGANGTISPMSRTVIQGSTTTFTVTPSSGYTASVTGCSGSLSGTTYTTGPITASCTVTASFTPNTSSYTVTANANPSNGGSASCNPTAVASGGSSICTEYPAIGFALSSWSGACSGTYCALSNITTSKSVTANFGDISSALESNRILWATGGDRPWVIQSGHVSKGATAMQSGHIGDNQSSLIGAEVKGPGVLTFDWTVSSEDYADHSGCFDMVTVYVDGVISTQVNNGYGYICGGNPDIWKSERVAIPSGTHYVIWVYSKDGSISTGLDAAWLDNVKMRRNITPILDLLLQ